jgi:hypothetical protein
MTSFDERLNLCIADLNKTSGMISPSTDKGWENLDCMNALERLNDALTYISQGGKSGPKIAFASAMRQAPAVSRYHRDLFNRGCALYKEWTQR